MKSLAQAFAVAAVLLVSAPVAQAASDKATVEEKLEDGVRALLGSVRLLLKAIPWYGPPEVQPNGDILIPRREGLPLPGDDEAENPSKDEDDANTKRL